MSIKPSFIWSTIDRDANFMITVFLVRYQMRGETIVLDDELDAAPTPVGKQPMDTSHDHGSLQGIGTGS